MPDTFTDLLLESTAPWNDTQGTWVAYNTAIGAMFETVFGLVSDQGDVEQTQLSVLSAPLSTSGPIASLPVQQLTLSVEANTEITLISQLNEQTFVTSSTVNAGVTSIPIQSATPNFTYQVGTPVQLAYVPGWSTLLDAINCPDIFLPFLAQFTGGTVPVGLDAATARLKILMENALQRGTLSAVKAAVQRNLTGTQSVTIEERIDASGNVNPYWFVVVVKPEEVVSVSALTAAVNAIKPGGVQWTLVQTDAWTISQMEASAPSVTNLEQNFATISGLEQDRPGT